MPKGALVLAVHPYTKGMGWVAFEAPFVPYDWGFACPKRERNRRCLWRLDKILATLQPELLVLEVSNRPMAPACPSVYKLYRSFIALAAARGIAVAAYSRADVQTCFAPVGAKTRQEIAEAIARHIAVFESLTPPARRPWNPQHRNMALFNAAALALTHYQREKLISPDDYLTG